LESHDDNVFLHQVVWPKQFLRRSISARYSSTMNLRKSFGYNWFNLEITLLPKPLLDKIFQVWCCSCRRWWTSHRVGPRINSSDNWRSRTTTLLQCSQEFQTTRQALVDRRTAIFLLGLSCTESFGSWSILDQAQTSWYTRESVHIRFELLRTLILNSFFTGEHNWTDERFSNWTWFLFPFLGWISSDNLDYIR
jgi:hypothetical protein